MEEKQAGNKVWRLAADSTAGRLSLHTVNRDVPVMEEDSSPQVARDDIVKKMMRIFDGLLGCTTKRTGMSLAFMHAAKTRPESGTQRKLEQEIYRLLKGLVEVGSPNIGFAVKVLFNNCLYYYNKANVPPSFGTFLTSLVVFLDGHDCRSICPDEMLKLKTLLARG